VAGLVLKAEGGLSSDRCSARLAHLILKKLTCLSLGPLSSDAGILSLAIASHHQEVKTLRFLVVAELGQSQGSTVKKQEQRESTHQREAAAAAAA